MKFSRRTFLIGSASMALVPLISLPTANAEECPRQKAFRLVDSATREYQTGNPFYKKIVTQLYEHLPTIPGPEKSFDETADEISVIFRGTARDGTQRNIDIMTCTNEAFAVSIARDMLRYRRLPIVQCAGWKPFAKRYTRFIMSGA